MNTFVFSGNLTVSLGISEIQRNRSFLLEAIDLFHCFAGGERHPLAGVEAFDVLHPLAMFLVVQLDFECLHQPHG